MKVLLLLLLPTMSTAQNIFAGKIVNKKNGSIVPFATVALLKENIGTNANDRGEFNLESFKNYTDTISISCVGFQTSKVALSNIPLDNRFELEAISLTLQSVIIGRSFSKTSNVLNEFSNCGNSSFTTSGFVTQMAQHFYSPCSSSILSEINICKTGDNAKFRIRVYNMDSITKAPSLDLLDTVLEVTSKGRHVNINVEKYRILLPHKDFFIAVEWLKIPYNKRETSSKSNGVRKDYIHYSPSISFKKNKNGTVNSDTQSKIWMKTYTGIWSRLDQSVDFFLISTKVKY